MTSGKSAVKKTGGGAFDPGERPLYFAAGCDWTGDQSTKYWPPYVLVAVNDVPTEDAERVSLIHHLDTGRRVLLDSGIFWLTNQHKRAHNTTMDEALALAPEEIDGFEELYARYTQLVNRHGDRLWGYIELDQGGAINKRRTRARLEAEGLAPTPVYHPLNDGWDYFDELASQYDRICMGNIVQARRPVRLRLLHTLWERRRAYPHLWVHILGLTVNEWCAAIPPDSCDSSTWLGPMRWPAVRTETAMLKKTQALPEGFTYELTAPGQRNENRGAAFNLCGDGVAAANIVWQHTTQTLAGHLDQGQYPSYLPGEKPPSPS